MLVAILTLSILTLVSIYFLFEKSKDEAREREVFRKWFFDSIYSLNPNIKVPEEFEKFVFKEPIVYNPNKDEMQYLKDGYDDWHDPDRTKLDR